MYSTKWIHSTWFIALLFAFWFLVIPLIFGIVLIVKQRNQVLNYLDRLKTNNELELRQLKDDLYGDLENQKKQYKEDIERLETEVKAKEKTVAMLTLCSKLKLIIATKELQSMKDQEEHNLNEIKRCHQEELEYEVNHKELKVARLTLLYMLRTVAIAKEIQFLEKKRDTTIQYFKNLHKIKIKELETTILERESELETVNNVIHRKLHQLNRLKDLQSHYKQEIIVLKDELLYQSFGFYDIRYDLEDSEEYKEELDKIRKEQKEAVKNDLAVNYFANWQLNNSLRKGQAMNKKNIKMAIRSFNNECDTVIHKVKFNNVESSEKMILKARDQLNKLNSYNQIEISQYYLNLKIQELYLAYEYAKKKNDEKEERRYRNELLREQAKAQKELEERLKVLNKELQHFLNAKESYLSQLENLSDEHLKHDMTNELQHIEAELKKIENEKLDLDYRVRNAKAGFVYVISNLGAFGENVFKIGMTRRLEPLDRIRELSAASVPFPYDVHAMIFTEDAPALENELHKAFNENRVNKVNNRKEFFRISLKEIEKVVREHYNKPVELVKVGTAQEYRETAMIEKKLAQKHQNQTVS